MLYPEGIYEQLGFLKIRKLLSDSILGPAGMSELERTNFITEPEKIKYELSCVQSYIEFKEEIKGFSLDKYADITPIFENFHIDNYTYAQEECKAIFGAIKLFKRIDNKLVQKKSKWDNLNTEVENFYLSKEVVDIFEKYLDDQGGLKDNSTPELKRITKEITQQQRLIDKLFLQVLQKYKKNKWLADAPEAMRGGRRVLSIISENKRKINGIIHDQSDTGKTTFIEPQETVFHYNEIQDLLHQRRKEFQRILALLSDAIRDHGAEIKINYRILGRLDLIQSKSKLANKIKGIMPKVSDVPRFGIKNAIHPLLWLKNNEEKKETVHFDFELHTGVRSVLISGPNAGGKSICLKAVGLLQMMLQHGLLVPMDEESTMGVFNSMFVDIGDHQSIDDELSTYSSKLVHMREVIDHADANSLVLMDEFGSGSDPTLGGAIGEGWLDQLMKIKSWAVLTTHYGNLKMYAHKRKGIINATMLFDKVKLQPLYKLHLGKPGSSYTLEIAQNVKLQSSVLNYAKDKIGKQSLSMEDVLVDLQSQKALLEEQNGDRKLQQKKLSQLIAQYDHLAFDLDVKKKKFLLDKKQWALQADHEKKRLLEKYIKELSFKEEIQALKKELKEAKNINKESEIEIVEIKMDILEDDLGAHYVFNKGDFVRVVGTHSSGEIMRINKNKAVIQSGQLTMTVLTADLRPINEPLDISKTRSIKIDKISDSNAFKSKIDIRGYSMQEARDTLDRFFDEAIMSSASQVQVLHGKGTGVLKRLVKEMTKDLKNVNGISYPADEEGGDGISIVGFK